MTIVYGSYVLTRTLHPRREESRSPAGHDKRCDAYVSRPSMVFIILIFVETFICNVASGHSIVFLRW
jgi:hypothetical protein